MPKPDDTGRDGHGDEMSDNEVDFSLFVRREFPTRFFAKGNTIFREVEQADEFFVVVHGEVEIRSGNRWFETVGPNGIFGEMAIIDDSTRSATVVALTDVTVVPISGTAVSFHGQAHAVLRTKGDARPRQPAAPAEHEVDAQAALDAAFLPRAVAGRWRGFL